MNHIEGVNFDSMVTILRLFEKRQNDYPEEYFNRSLMEIKIGAHLTEKGILKNN